MITTSRYATSETRKHAKKLGTENGERYLARGKKTIRQLVEWARKNGEEFITILEEKDKQPAEILKIKVNEVGDWSWA
ncbi:hypothetical protein HY988_06270 [Candidatus Micrarchaeota archaeon]|nr:hypothetical protein [Candidatus Micrarchaeota archaeon]